MKLDQSAINAWREMADRAAAIVAEKCPVHPRYQAKRRPTATGNGCVCMAIWNRKQQ